MKKIDISSCARDFEFCSILVDIGSRRMSRPEFGDKIKQLVGEVYSWLKLKNSEMVIETYMARNTLYIMYISCIFCIVH